MLEGGQIRPQLVFISYVFPPEACTAFIQKAKALPAGEDSAFVMILGARNDQNSTLFNSLFAGADGFLFEPYSIDDLVNMSQLAARVKSERRAAREALAVKFMVKDIIKYFDLMYRLKVAGCEYTQCKEKLEEACVRLHEMQPEARSRYFDLAVDIFTLTPTPTPAIRELTYKGKNVRMREKIEQRVLKGLERKEKNETEYGTKLKQLPTPGKPSST